MPPLASESTRVKPPVDGCGRKYGLIDSEEVNINQLSIPILHLNLGTTEMLVKHEADDPWPAIRDAL